MKQFCLKFMLSLGLFVLFTQGTIAVGAEPSTNLSLSRSKAITLALQNNARLHAYFRALGIKRQDLSEREFYEQPAFDKLFKNRDELNKLAQEHPITVAKIWKLPIRNRIAKSNSVALTLKIIQEVRATIARTNAYFVEYHYQEALLKIAQSGIHLFNDELKQTQEQFKAGIDNEISLYLIRKSIFDVAVAEDRVRSDLENIRTRFLKFLGQNPLTTKLILTGAIDDIDSKLLTHSSKQDWPVLQANRYDVQFIKNGMVDPDEFKVSAITQTLSIANHGRLTPRADSRWYYNPFASLANPLTKWVEPLTKKTTEQSTHKWQQQAEQIDDFLETDLRLLSSKLNILEHRIKYFKQSIIKAEQQAIAYAKSHPDLMRINRSLFLDLQRSQLKTKREYAKLLHDYHLTKLEYDMMIGKLPQ